MRTQHRLISIRMKRVILLTLTAAMLLALCGCSGFLPLAATPTIAPTATVVPTPTQVPTPTPLPTPTPTPAPQNRSQTSGKVIPEGTPSRPFIMSIDNANGAKPQTSLMQADIVYEFLVEQAITRFQAVFNDTYPIYAGPLRSTRYYIIDMVQEWDCMYLHEGYGFCQSLTGDIRKISSRSICPAATLTDIPPTTTTIKARSTIGNQEWLQIPRA